MQPQFRASSPLNSGTASQWLVSRFTVEVPPPEKSLALIGNPRRTPVGVKNRMHIAADFR